LKSMCVIRLNQTWLVNFHAVFREQLFDYHAAE
jgi:hypothetical protein